MSITIHHTTKTYPSLPYDAVLRAILGSRYSLSLVFVGAKRAQELNRTYRGAHYVPNVLSFPLSDDAGEIYITPQVALKESKKYNLTKSAYILYLFIHGLLHLRGLPHGEKMEREEQKYMKRFNA